MLFFLEAEIFQDNKCFKYVYLRKKKKKKAGKDGLENGVPIRNCSNC